MNQARNHFTNEILREKAAALPEGNWLTTLPVTNDNAWLCLTTTANGNAAEFDYVMAFIVHNHQAVFESAGFSIAARNYMLLARAFNWIITEFEAHGQRQEEARRAAAALADALPGWARTE